MSDDRLIDALEMAAGALSSIAKTLELEYQRKYPPKREVRDADLSYLKTEEEQLREDQGATGEQTIIDWTSIGPREKAFIEKEAAEQKRETSKENDVRVGKT